MGQPKKKKADSRPPAQWINVHGKPVHPDAPAGGGGPGRFSPVKPEANDTHRDKSVLPHPRSPKAKTADPNTVNQVAGQPPAATAPPTVTKATTTVVNGVNVTIKPDVSGARGIIGAKTSISCQIGGFTGIQFNLTPGQEVTSFTLPTVSVTIQTKYGTGKPSDVSAYGRGTTTLDVQSHNVSLGFHESCHRSDYLQYLQTMTPPTFAGQVGMTLALFKHNIGTWNDDWQTYIQALQDKSLADTDEVGAPTKSVFCGQNPGQCSE